MSCPPLLLAASPTLAAASVPPSQSTHQHQAPANVRPLPPDHDVAILGRSVAAPDGQTIGRLIDVLVDAAGRPEAAVIDFGGFMGVGARKIAVHWNTLRFTPGDHKHPITLELTPNQIKAAPEYQTTRKPVPVVVREAKPHVAASGTLRPASSAVVQTAHSVGR